MKNLLSQFLLLTTLFASCKNNSACSLTKAQVKTIQQNISSTLDSVFQDSANINLDKSLSPMWNSPDFVYVANGTALSFAQMKEMEMANLRTFKIQKFDFKNTDIDIISPNCAIATLAGTLRTTFNNDSTSEVAIGEMIVLKLIDNNWKIVKGNESFASR